MERLARLWYGEFAFDELQASSFPSLSILLFAVYALLSLLLLTNGTQRRKTKLKLNHAPSAALSLRTRFASLARH